MNGISGFVVSYVFACLMLWFYFVMEVRALGMEIHHVRLVYGQQAASGCNRFRLGSDLLLMSFLVFLPWAFPKIALRFHLAILLVLGLVLCSMLQERAASRHGYGFRLSALFFRLFAKPVIYGGCIGFMVCAFGSSHYARTIVMLCALLGAVSYLLVGWTSWRSLYCREMQGGDEVFHVRLVFLCGLFYLLLLLLIVFDEPAHQLGGAGLQTFRVSSLLLLAVFLLSFLLSYDMAFSFGKSTVYKLIALCSLGMVLLFRMLYPLVCAFENG